MVRMRSSVQSRPLAQDTNSESRCGMNIKRFFNQPDKVVLYGSGAYITLSFVLYYLIDLRNVFGSRDFLFSSEGVYFYFTYTPFFFQHYGRNGGFAEVVQWSLLAGVVVLALFYAGKWFDRERQLAYFWLLFGLGALFMLLEDAGDVRHFFMSYVQWMAGEPDQGLWGTLFEGVYFIFLGSLPLIAFFYFRNIIKQQGKVYIYMLWGIILHAIAATASFVGTAFQMTLERDIYTILGDGFKALSLSVADPEVATLWQQWDSQNWLYQVDFYLMDSFFEENLELLGNAFFLAATLSVFSIYVTSVTVKEKN